VGRCQPLEFRNSKEKKRLTRAKWGAKEQGAPGPSPRCSGGSQTAPPPDRPIAALPHGNPVTGYLGFSGGVFVTSGTHAPVARSFLVNLLSYHSPCSLSALFAFSSHYRQT